MNATEANTVGVKTLTERENAADEAVPHILPLVFNAIKAASKRGLYSITLEETLRDELVIERLKVALENLGYTAQYCYDPLECQISWYAPDPNLI